MLCRVITDAEKARRRIQARAVEVTCAWIRIDDGHGRRRWRRCARDVQDDTALFAAAAAALVALAALLSLAWFNRIL